MDYAARLRGLQREMVAHDEDLVIFGNCPNFQYLTGVPLDWRAEPDMQPAVYNAVVPREGRPTITAAGPLDAPPEFDVRILEPGQTYVDLLKAIGGLPKRIGVGAHLHGHATVAIRQAFPEAEWTDASRRLDRVRMIKEPEEIERLRAVAKLTDEVLETVVAGIGEGSTQNDLMLRIEMEARHRGASHMSFSPFVGFMRSGAGVSEHIANVHPDEGLLPDTAICFDVGFVLNGYASDWGRSVFWGSPSDDVVLAHQALRDAVLEVVSELRDGSHKASDMYPRVVKALDDRGYGDHIRRRLEDHKGIGHSIGVEVHEHPWLGVTCEEPLRENMVLAIEPKLWLLGEYYLRLEELVLIKKDGAEFLTNFDRDLFVL